jgi:hypothetical protein
MDWLAWFASRHTWLVHLPAAAALVIPIPLLAAQRGGRGIRPWWTTCRFLAWAGVVGAALASASGLLAARGQGLPLPGTPWILPPPGLARVFWLHEAGGLGSLLLGLACLRSLYRKRQDHQGIGLAALVLGLLWCLCALGASYVGPYLLGRTQPPSWLAGRQ